MKVGIIGGGFSGLLSASKLIKYVDVDVYEEHYTIGYPRHCTGLVSEYVVNYLRGVVDPHILNSFKRYLVVHTLRPRNPIELRFRGRVYLVDRPRMEEELATVIQAHGGVLKLGSKITSIRINQRPSLLTNYGRMTYDLVVIAEGARNIISRSLRLCNYVDYLIGSQVVVRCPNSLDSPYVLFGDDVSREFFGWIVPVDEKHLIVGLADKSNVGLRLRYLLEKYLKLIGGRSSSDLYVTKVFGGLIPISKPCQPVSDNFIGLGDAISSTKPISGGGIYSICRQVKILEDSIRLNNVARAYSLKVRELMYELMMQHLIKLLISRKFGGLQDFLLGIVDSGVTSLSIMDYDRYLPGLSSMLKLVKSYSYNKLSSDSNDY